MNRLSPYIDVNNTDSLEIVKNDKEALVVKFQTKVKDRISYHLIIFKGRAKKPLRNCSFDKEVRDNIIEREIEKIKKTNERKAQQRELDKNKRQEAANNVEIGDVFYTSWGYEQTNVDFYQVVGKKGQTIELRPIAQRRIETGYMQGETSPVLDTFIGESFKKRINAYGSIRMTSYSSASKVKIQRVAGTITVPSFHWSAYA